jgi:penicillin-binding protein 2
MSELESQHFKDHLREARIFQVRLVFISLAILVMVGILVFRYHNLQVVNHLDYATQSERNRVHVQPIPPTRGLIYDRNGIMLADNRPTFTLSVIVQRTTKLDETLALLQQLVAIEPSDIARFQRAVKQRRHPLEPVPLRYRLTEEEIAHLAINEYRLDGVEVDAQLVRYYPHGELFAHTMGYTARISENDLAKFTEEQDLRYRGTYSIGKTGLEYEYEDLLHGQVGSQNVETNARGRVLRVLDREDPAPGKDLHLHLDIRLQNTAIAAMAGRRGAVVAIDVKTGGVLSAVSLPSYDPNLFVTGIGHEDFRNLNESIDRPLYNRFIQGVYPPGSTIKPVIALAGLHYGATDVNRSISDPGFYRLPNTQWVWRDWKRGGHGGSVNLKQAVAESCDTYFYDLGSRLGVDRMSEFGAHFGLGLVTGVDIPNERKGVWPSRDWKRGARGESWYPGDTVNMSIGQGYVLSSPMQLALMTATLASRGQRIRPTIVRAIGDQPLTPAVDDVVEASAEHWDAVFDAMAEVLHGARGSARAAARDAPYRMAGKSGTAQVVGIPQGAKYDSAALAERHRDHALFVSFAPLEDPQIAVAVIVENGEGGSSQAAPVARKVMDAYLLGRYLTPDGVVPPPGMSDRTGLPMNNVIEERAAQLVVQATSPELRHSGISP